MAFIMNEKREIQNYYQYDAFGNGICQEEGISNRICYTGQQYDGVTGQYYLRARYYNPIVGRFLQEDEYQGDGLNLYAYCGNNPVRYYDPSGYSKKKTAVNRTICEFETINGDAGKENADTSKIITNSAGQEVIRKYVNDEDELLKMAEEAAGGNLDDFKEFKPGWYLNEEETIKIEWNMEGHDTTNEGPHVTVRHKNKKGAWNVKAKYFIKGQDYYKKPKNKQ